MRHDYNDKFKEVDKRLDGQDAQLGRIEKLLNNHLAHEEKHRDEQKKLIDLWLKIVIPTITVMTPILVKAMPLVQEYMKHLWK